MLVRLAGGGAERPAEPDLPPVEARSAAEVVRALADAGADEVIFVCDPITEASVRELAAALEPLAT